MLDQDILYTGQAERKAGVGFAVRPPLVSQLESHPQDMNDRTMTMRLPLSYSAYSTLLSVYAPNMTNQDEHKEAFYQQLDEVIRSVPAGDKLIILRISTRESAQITQHGLALLVNMVSVMRTQITNFRFRYAPSTISQPLTHSSN